MPAPVLKPPTMRNPDTHTHTASLSLMQSTAECTHIHTCLHIRHSGCIVGPWWVGTPISCLTFEVKTRRQNRWTMGDMNKRTEERVCCKMKVREMTRTSSKCVSGWDNGIYVACQTQSQYSDMCQQCVLCVCVCVPSVALGKEFTGLLEKQEGMSCSGSGRVEEEGKSTEQPPHYITRQEICNRGRERESAQNRVRRYRRTCTHWLMTPSFSHLISPQDYVSFLL